MVIKSPAFPHIGDELAVFFSFSLILCVFLRNGVKLNSQTPTHLTVYCVLQSHYSKVW